MLLGLRVMYSQIFFFFFFFLSYAFLASLGSLETIPFKEVNLVHFIHPLLGFHTHSRLFLFVLQVGPYLQFTPFAGTCYDLYLLLVRGTCCTYYQDMLTICTHYWDVLQLVSIAGICYKLCPFLVHATGCTHWWYMLQVVAITGICLQSSCIIGTCHGLYP